MHRGFIPSPGHLRHLAPPPTTPTIRVDTGVRQGDHVTTFYDPMIAKLVVWGADRLTTIKKLKDTLSQYQVSWLAHRAHDDMTSHMTLKINWSHDSSMIA